jgi:transcription initiation factor TFIIE subunit alpha
VLNAKKKKVLSKLKERMDYEIGNMFFFCPTDNLRFVFDEAMETNFQCTICGGRLESIQNKEIIEVLRIKIDEIEKSLAE